MEVTVRHTPFTAMLSPVLVPCSTLEACISMLPEVCPVMTFRIVPTSSMIPVNMFVSFIIRDPRGAGLITP